MLEHIFSGAIITAAIVIAMFFRRFQKQTADPLFGYFALAFVLLGIERVCVEAWPSNPRSLVYLIRLASFFLIAFAIVEKNREDHKQP